MDKKENLNQTIERIGWGLLAILWGTVILFDSLPFAIGLVGTGLILFGANIIRSLNGLPRKDDNTIPGILLLAWSGLEFARPWLGRVFPSADLDWVIFAILLTGWGLILLMRALLAARDGSVGTLANTHED